MSVPALVASVGGLDPRFHDDLSVFHKLVLKLADTQVLDGGRRVSLVQVI